MTTTTNEFTLCGRQVEIAVTGGASVRGYVSDIVFPPAEAGYVPQAAAIVIDRAGRVRQVALSSLKVVTA